MKTGNKKKFTGSDRRRWPRVNPSDLPFLKGVAFNQGSPVHVIDISQGGMLLETDVRLRPQMRILFKIATNEGVFKIAGNVLRSEITSLKGGPRYQSAIVFEHPFHLLQQNDNENRPAESQGPSPEPVQPVPDESNDQRPQATPVVEPEDTEATFTLIALDANGISLQENLRLNDW